MLQYRRINKSSKTFACVRNAKHGEEIYRYLGFRNVVFEFREHFTLATSSDDWLELFRKKLELIKDQQEKRLAAAAKESRSKEGKVKEKQEYKDIVLGRIAQQREDSRLK